MSAKEYNITASALSHTEISPRNFSGRVERLRVSSKPNLPYTWKRKSSAPLTSASI